MTPRARLRLLALASILTLAACSKESAGPLEPPPTPPTDSPQIVTTVPAARSEGVVYDTEIWAGFDRALEASSVDSTSVFLKLDTQRLPCTITYEAAPRRIRLRPRVTLQLQRTYTVEFAATIQGLDGTTLGERRFFQFKTNSLRRPTYAYPDSLTMEGPLVMLGWGGNGGVTSTIIHEVYASADSTAVANRTLPALQRGTALGHFPRAPWPRGTRVYWSVTTENALTGERLNGRVRWFTTFPEGWPVDSLVWANSDYGGSRNQTPRIQYCNQVAQFTGPDHSLAAHFRTAAGVLPTVAIESARMYVPLQPGYSDSLAVNPMSAWQTTTDFTACSFGWSGPPFPEPTGFLGDAEACAEANTAMLRSTAIGAWLEQSARSRGVPGIQWRAARMIGTALSSVTPSRAVVVYLRRDVAPIPALARAE